MSTKSNAAQSNIAGDPLEENSKSRTVNLAVARDDLLKMRVYLGDTAATAIIDTGSQLNLIREDIFTATGLVRTEESTVSVTGATGDGDTCIGMIPEAEVYISSGKIMTLGPEIHVVETAPFQVLLGRPWLTLNGVSIEECIEGTCVALEVDEKRYVINVSPNPEFVKQNGGRSRIPPRSTRARKTYLISKGDPEEVVDETSSDEEEDETENEDDVIEVRDIDVKSNWRGRRAKIEGGDEEFGGDGERRRDRQERVSKVRKPKRGIQDIPKKGAFEALSSTAVVGSSISERDPHPLDEDPESDPEEREEKEVHEGPKDNSVGKGRINQRSSQARNEMEGENDNNNSSWGIKKFSVHNNAGNHADSEENHERSETLKTLEVDEDDVLLNDVLEGGNTEGRASTRERKIRGEVGREAGASPQAFQQRRNSQNDGKAAGLMMDGSLSEDESDSEQKHSARTETKVSMHEEIIRLIRAGASEAEWNQAQERERDRLEEEELRWKTIQNSLQDDEADYQDPRMSGAKEPSITSESEEGTPTTSRKRKIKEPLVPTMKEQVIRRSQRATKLTYKARQPEFDRFMRRTRITSEETTRMEPVHRQKKSRKAFALMAMKAMPREPRMQSPLESQRDPGGSQPSNVRSDVGSHQNDELELEREMKRGSDARPAEGHEARKQGKGKAAGIEITNVRNREVKRNLSGSELEGFETIRKRGENVQFEDDSDVETDDKDQRREPWAEGKHGQRHIKARRIAVKDLTYFAALDRYWHNGRLRPHTSIYFAPLIDSMQLPPTPLLPRSFLPASPRPLVDRNPYIQKAFYPPNGLSEKWNGLTMIGSMVESMRDRIFERNLVQTNIELHGCLLVIEDPKTRGKHIF